MGNFYQSTLETSEIMTLLNEFNSEAANVVMHLEAIAVACQAEEGVHAS